jgi:hypothetical protein
MRLRFAGLLVVVGCRVGVGGGDERVRGWARGLAIDRVSLVAHGVAGEQRLRRCEATVCDTLNGPFVTPSEREGR